MSGIMRARLLGAMGIGLVAFSLAGSAFGQASTWTNAVNGVWSNAAMWSAAGVPNTNAANLTAGNGSYTVTVDAVLSNPFSGLTITNNWGNTTLLDINAAGFESRIGSIVFGRGAVVNVNGGGVMTYTGTNWNNITIASVNNGGLWNIAGGAVWMDLTCTGGFYNANVNVGDSGTTGRLTMTSGTYDLRGHSNTMITLQLGSGGGSGIMQMTGGTGIIAHVSDYSWVSGLVLGSGSGSRGELTLTNNATMIVSNWSTIGTGGGTGIVTVSGNASNRFVGRNLYGCDTKSMAVINVRDNGYFADVGGASFGGYGSGNGGTGVLNISGGRFRADAGITLCDCGPNTAGYGEINLSGGILEMGPAYGYGLFLCRTGGTNNLSRAVLNISGTGLLRIYDMWNMEGWGSPQGLGVGTSKAAAPFSAAYGRVNMSGGTITNRGQYVVGVWPGGTGEVYQTSGTVWQRTWPLTVGWGGGVGLYSMAGGTFWSDKSVFVGGITTTELTYNPSANFTNASVGVLNVSSGTLQTTAGLYVGDWGAGTLTIGSYGQVQAGNVIMTNNGSSKLRFEVATNGAAGQLVVANKLTVYPGAKLEVYVPRSYVPDVPVKVLTLATYATNVGSFAAPDVTVSNYPGATVVQTTTRIQVRIPSRQGTLILIR